MKPPLDPFAEREKRIREERKMKKRLKSKRRFQKMRERLSKKK